MRSTVLPTGSMKTERCTLAGRQLTVSGILRSETGAITFGWINWNNRNYYISEEKGKYTGLEQVDGEYCPFSEENGAIQEGMQKMPDGTTRYY